MPQESGPRPLLPRFSSPRGLLACRDQGITARAASPVSGFPGASRRRFVFSRACGDGAVGYPGLHRHHISPLSLLPSRKSSVSAVRAPSVCGIEPAEHQRSTGCFRGGSVAVKSWSERFTSDAATRSSTPLWTCRTGVLPGGCRLLLPSDCARRSAQLLTRDARAQFYPNRAREVGLVAQHDRSRPGTRTGHSEGLGRVTGHRHRSSAGCSRQLGAHQTGAFAETRGLPARSGRVQTLETRPRPPLLDKAVDRSEISLSTPNVRSAVRFTHEIVCEGPERFKTRQSPKVSRDRAWSGITPGASTTTGMLSSSDVSLPRRGSRLRGCSFHLANSAGVSRH